MTILIFLLLLFSFSKACPLYGKVTLISRPNTNHQHILFKNVSGVVRPKYFFFLIYFIQGLALEAIKDSISCSLPEDVCFTDSGEDYYSSCVFPFIDNGIQFKACTDVNSKNESRKE